MKKLIAAEDLVQLTSVTDPNYSPDGTKVAYVKTKINEKKDSYNSHIIVYDTNQGQSYAWTHGKEKSHSPKWSPDGKKLAFVSKRDETSSIYVLRTDGGEAKKVAETPYDLTQPVWAPDGKSIVCSAKLTNKESLDDEKKAEIDSYEPLEIESLQYKADGVGFTRGKYSQLVLIDIETGALQQLTDHETNHSSHVFTPDGQAIAFTANYSEDKELNYVYDIHLLSLDDKKIRRLTNENGMFSSVSFSNDGRYAAFLGHEKEFKNATLTKAWIYDFHEEKLSCLTESLEVIFEDAVVGDTVFGAVSPDPIWTKDNKGFYALATDQGNTAIYYISIEGHAYPVRLEKEHINGFSLHPEEHTAIISSATPSWPSELYELNLETKEAKRITDVNESFVNEHIIIEPEEIEFESYDGITIHGWLLKPAEYEEGKKYPLILEVHGGPHAMYANAYFHEFQVLAAKGNAVVFVNPRGSHGYGQAYVDGVRGDYGGGDYEDVMKAVDYVLGSYQFLDETRLGVTGGSYGGFMTNWIVGQTNRFKAAVTQRSISNWLSFYGVSDIGYFFTGWQLGYDLFENPTKLWEFSPLKYAENISTPLLILHGERDDRCPVEQAEQLFVALKKMKKNVKFVRFPNAAHNLSRSGHPEQRIKRLNYISGWFEDYL